MKVWLFYRKPVYGTTDVLSLYAFTNSERTADGFRAQRDACKFVIKEENFSKKEFEILSMDRHDLLLKEQAFRTKMPGSCNLEIPVKIFCTYQEENQVHIKGEDMILKEIGKHLPDPKIIAPEYLPALENLLYIRFYGFLKNQKYGFDDNYYNPYFTNFNPDEIIYDDLRHSYRIDELCAFLLLHGSTFKDPSKLF